MAASAGATGTWSVTLTVYLQSNTDRYVAGPDGNSGQTSAEVYVKLEGTAGGDWLDSNVVNITATNLLP
ncbi:MAG: hypothetical protein L0Y71_00830 [Gemmataceae bacterium]|nr:hypothetical protein [Gemmataceae bacterium]